jgi:uncharacterized protein
VRIRALYAIGGLVALQALQIPQPIGYVNDFADAIPAPAEARALRIITDVRAKSRGEITLVTLRDIGQADVADVARRIGREWGVGATGNPGDSAKNAGVVILIVPKETNSDGRGRCRIEVGRGSEGFITDGTAGSICREATPLFQQRDYGGGALLITTRVAEAYAREFHFALDSASVPVVAQQRTRQRSGPPIPVFVIAFMVFLVMSAVMRGGRGGRGGGSLWPLLIALNMGRRGRSGWGGGGFGGGGGGGGFGGFGGGGGFSGGGGGSSW